MRMSKMYVLNEIVALIFVIFLYSIFFDLSAVLPPLEPSTREVIQIIPMVMGGASAIFFVFRAETPLSKRMSLLSFLCSTLILFIKTRVDDPDIGILIIISCVFSFFFAFYFMEEKRSIQNSSNLCFLLLLTGRIWISPEIAKWEMAFVLQLIFLWNFSFLEEKETFLQKRSIFIYIIFLFILLVLYNLFYNLNPRHNIHLVFLLALAAAGAIQFLFLSKTYFGQNAGFCVYFFANVFLGNILTGETFPKITLNFIFFNILFLISLWLINLIKGQGVKFSNIISESKTSLRAIDFPLLYLLYHLFCSADSERLDIWIASLSLQILIFQLLTFILKKEDPDKQDKDKDKDRKKNSCN